MSRRKGKRQSKGTDVTIVVEGPMTLPAITLEAPKSPIEDQSRWSMISKRIESPPGLVEELQRMMAEAYGAEQVEKMRAAMPPPHGTMSQAEVDAQLQKWGWQQ